MPSAPDSDHNRRAGHAGQRTIIAALVGIILLLVGLIIGQNLQRSQHEVLNPSTAPAAPSQSLPPLSATEYWITTPSVDATRTGVSAWAVLRVGGNFVLEQCRAPDYTLPENPEVQLPAPIAQCELIIDGIISRLSDSEVLVADGKGPARTFRYALMRDPSNEQLVLGIGQAATVTLVAGDKNSLFDRLSKLPGDADARARYVRRMYGLR